MNLFYTESGGDRGGTPIILIHGFCETHQVWSRFEPALSKDFRVLCPDLPGFGKSPLPAGELSLTTVAHILYDWLREQEINSCILIGHSLGGYVSLALLEEHPEIIDGIGLFNSTAYADTEEKKKTRNNVIAFVEKHGVEKYIESFVPPLFYPPNRERLQPEISELISVARKTPRESLIAYTRAMQQRKDRLQVLQHFKGPILYIAGEQDTAVPLEDSKKQIRSLSNYEVHILKNTGHMGMYEKPEESLEAVKNFANYVEDQKKSS